MVQQHEPRDVGSQDRVQQAPLGPDRDQSPLAMIPDLDLEKDGVQFIRAEVGSGATEVRLKQPR